MRDIDVAWMVAFLKQKQVTTDPNVPGFLKYTGGSMESHAIPCRVKGMRSPVAGEIHMLQQKLHKVSWWGYLGHICSKRLLWAASEFAATLKPRHQGDAGPISLQDKGEKMLRIGSILTIQSVRIHFTSEKPYLVVCRSCHCPVNIQRQEKLGTLFIFIARDIDGPFSGSTGTGLRDLSQDFDWDFWVKRVLMRFGMVLICLSIGVLVVKAL